MKGVVEDKYEVRYKISNTLVTALYYKAKYLDTRFRMGTSTDSIENERLTRSVTAEPVSRDHNSQARKGNMEKNIFPVLQLTTPRIGN